MPALPSRRPPLCLFCAFTLRAQTQRRLLPLVQIAQRTAPSSSSRGGSRQPSLFQQGTYLGRTHSSYIEDAVQEPLDQLRRQFEEPEFLESLQLNRERFEEEWAAFTRSVRVWLKRATPEAQALLRERSKRRLQNKLRYLFYDHTYGSRFTRAELENQKQLANLCYPAEWYPRTRTISRTVHLHVGPTNSGKTYHALKRLEEAESGIYLGPLRLLAHEVYTRLNAKGRHCALVTGEEQRMPDHTSTDDVKMWSCTVEMAPLNKKLDVAVIDEIQMINHSERGWAWTQAFLGIRAKEIHVCGEARTVPLIRELCALVGDTVEIHEYKRLSPLRIARRSLGGQIKNNLEKGDCIVSFSVLGIHALRRTVEKATGRKCAVVYGGLPPETRAQQARLFNDPDNDYDFLVASDAIGMGLNLSIKRVIFETTMKNNGSRLVPLAISEVKQIAGRAGRYKTSHQAITQDIDAGATSEAVEDIRTDPSTPAVQPDTETVGYATTLDSYDYNYLKQCMAREPEPILTAGVFPPSIIVERFSSYFPPNTPFSYILQRLHEISKIHPRFHLCELKDQVTIADIIRPVTNLSIQQRLQICAAPTNAREEDEQVFLRELARCIAENREGHLLEVPIPLEILDQEPSAERKYLYSLEQLHRMLVLYLWLSYRFPNVFTTRALANVTKKLVEDKIDMTLTQFSVTEQRRQRLLERRAAAMKRFETEANDPEKAEGGVDDFAEETEVDNGDAFPTPELDVDEVEGPSEGDAETRTAHTPTERAPISTEPLAKDAGFLPADQPGSTEARI
ncbi:P-loop containing nucleoside triphosphate hydrolase protein [Lophiostoma macrostomum CBS 122681]|uniref:RNA helicase n=1 Tax=Lophiostoma macrostomum CBS 122681 TaxID=1314788 RepID=A0A6A6TGB1_9PLEO|nr:P-loop containing nucleoside triphosphate hydrolase protein [Lophiostoma macrostomum CBS 122681]